MKIIKKISTSMIVGTLAVSLIACGKPKAPTPPPPAVTAEVIHKAEIPINYEYAARIVSYRETEVRARVGGILLHRNFVEGAEVKQGDVLFEIDPNPYEALVASAHAQVAQAQANYDQSIRDAQRAEELFVQRVQSTAQRDQAYATRDANLALLMQAKAQLRTATLNLEYTKVTAPISGLTSREAVSEGSLIGTDSTTSLLTTITQRDPVYVNFSFTDEEATEMKNLLAEMAARGEDAKKLNVTVHFGDGSDYGTQGVVDFTSPTIDEQTGTLGARAVIENTDHRLTPGMFVRVTVTGLKMANATTVPEKSLIQTNAGQYVYVLKKPEPVQTKAGEAAVEEPKLADGARLMDVEQRQVKVIRQLQNGDWLLEPTKTYEEDAPAEQTENQTKDTQTGSANKTSIVKKITKILGVQDQEEVVTDGLMYIQSGLGRLEPGQAFKVQAFDKDLKTTNGADQAKTLEPAK